jgi:hypothetical protein
MALITEDSQNRTARTGNLKRDRRNRTGRTGLPGKDCPRKGLPDTTAEKGHCLDRAAKTDLLG